MNNSGTSLNYLERISLSVSHEFFGIEKTTKNQREKLDKNSSRLDVLIPPVGIILTVV